LIYHPTIRFRFRLEEFGLESGELRTVLSVTNSLREKSEIGYRQFQGEIPAYICRALMWLTES
jgi:hypothetical protein